MNLDILNDRQKEAVVETEGRIRVVAGAGSGKTRALSYRYAFIVNELGIDPANILCLTFTNKAAQEMKSRIQQLVPPGYANDYVCTIHGFCVRFLREEIFRLGYPKSFQILDEEDMKSLAKQVLTENNTERSTKTVRDLLEKLAGLKSHNPYITQYLTGTAPVTDRTTLPLNVQLLYKQKDKLALDFDDLLAFTLHILKAYPDVCRKWQENMNYVMVDEAQDCNSNDWELVETLSEESGNLFIVGDPDQSIYEWRGAKPDRFLSFQCAKTIVLDQNYRSTKGILGVANSIIVNNRNRIEKSMFTNKGNGDSVVHFHARNENMEAEWVCAEILKKVEEGSSFSDCAVLFRAAHLSRFIEQAFINAGIPYVMWGGVRFFEREEVKDCISYLRLVASDDDLAFERVINKPSRKVGKTTLEVISSYALSDNTSLYQALRNHLGEGKLSKDALKDFVDLIEECRSKSQETSVAAMLEYILEKTSLKKEYRDDNDEQRLENIAELLNSIRMWESARIDEDSNLESYLQDIALYTNADYRKETNKVKMMTVHQSKGLEFPYVFIIGLSEGIFPNARAIRERKKTALEEERRLMYVATTRAERCLYLTESEGFNVQAHQDKLPSRFIAEIKRELFVTEGDMDAMLWQKLKNLLLVEGLDDSDDDDVDEGDDNTKEPAIKAGSSVEHSVWGVGEVLEITESGSCKVRFGIGIRTVRRDLLKPVISISVNLSPRKGPLN